MPLALVVVLTMVILFDVMNKTLPGFGVPLAVICTLRVIHGATCALVLYVEYQMLFGRRMELDKRATEQLLVERGRQYDLSRETIAAVNRRVHDIRHDVLRMLDTQELPRKTLAEVARRLDVYDAQVRTGNEALDTVLTEKRLLCQHEGIVLTCIAEGTCLAHLAPVEAYALVGGVLDASVEAVGTVSDPTLRTISLVVRPLGEMATVHVECFCAGEMPGLERTEEVVDRREGFVVAEVSDGILVVDVNLSMP